MTTKQIWAFGVLLSVATGSLGYGFSQMTSIQPLEKNVVELSVNQRKLDEAFKEERARTDQRILKVVDLVESANNVARESISQTGRLVDTIGFQNKLLQDNYKLIQQITKQPGTFP